MSEQQGSQASHLMRLDGEVVGNHYLLDEKVGQGGMAWVYRATHKLLGGNVAVKILFPQLAEDENIRQRFLREARIQYQLEHPNIVRVLDFVEERGLVGFVAEWCSGGDLVDWLKAHNERALSSGEIRSIFMPLLSATHIAHEHEVVHRDLKPHNIMLHQRGEILLPKLTDFGVAKQASDQGLTSTGMVVGTVHYMSPEQLYESKSVDLRSDIFSLGIILYQLASGELPFVGETPSIFMKILEGEPAPIRDIPGPLNDIIQQCLAKRPEDRFADCMELQAALNQCLEPPLPILPVGQAVTESAMKQARAGFASSVSVYGSSMGHMPTLLPSADIHPDAIAETHAMPTFESKVPAALVSKEPAVLANKPARKRGWGKVLLFLFVLSGFAGGGLWWLSIQKTSIGAGTPDASVPPVTPDKKLVQPPVRRRVMVVAENISTREKPPVREPSMGPEPVVRDASVPLEKRWFRESRLSVPEARVVVLPKKAKPQRRPSGKSLSRRCRRGSGKACYQLGRKELRKKYWAIDYRLARRLFRRACRLRVGNGCSRLGTLLYLGKGGARNFSRARRLFVRACRLKDAVGCRELGWIYQKGKGVRINNTLARYYYQQACRYKGSSGCNFLGLMFRQGVGGQRSNLRALGLYRRSCRMKNKIGCFNVAMMYDKGWGVSQNIAKAYRLYTRSCRMRFGRACHSAAKALWKRRRRKACRQINKLLRRACVLKFKQACRESCSTFKSGGTNWLKELE